jgi:prepilin-type N-terminal cleavage/methylation domain-containing protein
MGEQIMKISDRGRRCGNDSFAFTLIELMVVVAIIVVLSALLLSALGSAKAKGYKALCQSNMRQWGLAYQMYANENADYFPDNKDGLWGVHYAGTNVQQFWRSYLLPWVKTRTMKALNNVLFCPTDKRHRLADLQPGLNEAEPVFAGYFMLPHRDIDRWGGARWDYDVSGIAEWHTREKMGGEHLKAPILGDRIQAGGNSLASGHSYLKPTPELFWVVYSDRGPLIGRIADSAHATSRGIPKGGNYLFEDGHVSWYPLSQIELGSRSKPTPTYLCYYKIPVETN